MTEAIRLPTGDELRGTFHNLGKQRCPGLFGRQAGCEMAGQQVLAQLAQLSVLTGVVEILEVPEADMAGCQAHEHGGTLFPLAPDRGLRAGHAQRPRGGNAQCVQVFAGQELADRAAQHCAAIAHA